MLQPLNFSSNTALIIGASPSTGLATTETLAAYGASVILAARSIEKTDRLDFMINNAGTIEPHSMLVDSDRKILGKPPISTIKAFSMACPLPFTKC